LVCVVASLIRFGSRALRPSIPFVTYLRQRVGLESISRPSRKQNTALTQSHLKGFPGSAFSIRQPYQSTYTGRTIDIIRSGIKYLDLHIDMKYTVTAAALIAACASTVLGDAQLVNGNWYDSAVERIMFTNWGQAGTYNKVTDMSNGQCLTEEVAFSGGMSPLDGEVSFDPLLAVDID